MKVNWDRTASSMQTETCRFWNILKENAFTKGIIQLQPLLRKRILHCISKFLLKGNLLHFQIFKSASYTAMLVMKRNWWRMYRKITLYGETTSEQCIHGHVILLKPTTASSSCELLGLWHHICNVLPWMPNLEVHEQIMALHDVIVFDISMNWFVVNIW